MNVLIFGLGNHKGGYSAARYYLSRGDSVRVTDLREEAYLKPDVDTLKRLGASFTLTRHDKSDFEWADLVIKNPAVAQNNPFLTMAKNISTDIIELCLAAGKRKNVHLIGITGTKGKSSTAHTIYHQLLCHKEKALLCGNIGISAFTIIDQVLQNRGDPLYIVMELSSWQIHDLYTFLPGERPLFHSLILTSLYPDHLDAYASTESYYRDKMLLFDFPGSHLFMAAQSIKALEDLNIPHPSNIRIVDSNSALITAVLTEFGLSEQSIRESYRKIPHLPHRKEIVRTTGKVTWINDSSATIPQASDYSVRTLDFPYILICGGSEKNSEIPLFHDALTGASHLILIEGTFTRSRLLPYITSLALPFSGPYSDMTTIVKEASEIANRDGRKITVILSPGAASFGPFRNSDDRGRQFTECVGRLL